MTFAISSLLFKVRLLCMDNLEKILAQFIDVETGECLTCGHVHSFHNIDEARERRRRQNKSSDNSPCLDRLFWEAAV